MAIKPRHVLLERAGRAARAPHRCPEPPHAARVARADRHARVASDRPLERHPNVARHLALVDA
eukprot:5754517-Prymnesium_polylepis.1